MKDSEEKTMDEEKGQTEHNCEDDGCKGHECEGKQCAKCERCGVAKMTARSPRFIVAQETHEAAGHKGPAEKCGECMPNPPYVSLGGATSFAEADAFDEAEDIEFHIRQQERLFRRITENIFGSDDMSLPEKLAKVKAAATELEGRLEKPADEKGLLERAKERLGQVFGGVDYIYYGTDKATKKEDGKDYPASDFAYVPDATKPSTWKLRLTSTPGGKPDARIVGAAVAALGKGFRGQKVQIPAAALAGVKAKVRAAWRKANPDKKAEDMPAAIKEATPGAFTMFKDADGNWRWLTLTSNMWRDRDGEIIPAAAHEENVAYANRTKDMPELRLWHVPGSRVGVADWAAFAHGFLLHSGNFDKGMEDVAESLSKETQGMSHGFFYEKNEGHDTYRSYRDFEASTLPPERAANEWTEFNAERAKEVVMGLRDDQRLYLVKHMGEARVAAIEKGLEEKEEELKAAGVDYKEILVTAIEATPAPDTKPAEGKGEGDAPKGDDAIAKLVTVIEAQGAQLTEIATAQAEQGEQIKELQRSDDEKIAAKMVPERKPPANGERPTDAEGNVLTEEQLKAQGINPNEADDGLGDSPGAKALRQIGRKL